MARRAAQHPTRNVLLALNDDDANTYQAKYTGVDDALIILVAEATPPTDAVIDQVHATTAVRAHPEYLAAAEILKAARGITPAPVKEAPAAEEPKTEPAADTLPDV